MKNLWLIFIFLSATLFAESTLKSGARVQGEIVPFVEDDFEHGVATKKWALHIGDRDYWIAPKQYSLLKKYAQGDRIEANITTDATGQISLWNTALIAKNRDALAAYGMSGVRNLAILAIRVVDKAGDTSIPVDLQFLKDQKVGIENFMKDVSFQHITMPADVDGNGIPDVFGTFQYVRTLPNICQSTEWATAAKAQAQSQGIDLTKYQHVAIAIYGNNLGCSWAGLAQVGCAKSCTSWWIGKNPRVTWHELGHNLGFGHAATDPDDNLITTQPYGDNSCVMGAWGGLTTGSSAYNAPHMVQQSWLKPNHLQTVTATGTYAISGLREDYNNDDVRVLLIPRFMNLTQKYMVSYRSKVGLDNALATTYVNKVSIHSHNGTSAYTFLDAELALGEQWTSKDGQMLTITFVDVVDGQAVLDVSFGG